MTDAAIEYWNAIADQYQFETEISTEDFHFGPLLPGNNELDILPSLSPGTRCLELGCGAAQNSIYLANQGASCTALDGAEKQLRVARDDAVEAGVEIDFICSPMEELDALPSGSFDLVHSSFALCFSERPCHVIRESARLLAPGGHLLLSTAHPLFAGEWLEVDGEGMGVFLGNYFSPPDDERPLSEGVTIASHAYPVSTIAEWIVESGLALQRLLEPPAVDAVSDPSQLARIPYVSDTWLQLTEQLQHIPIAAIYLARRPL